MGMGMHGHTFFDLIDSDHAEFDFADASGNVVLSFNLDYCSADVNSPSTGEPVSAEPERLPLQEIIRKPITGWIGSTPSRHIGYSAICDKSVYGDFCQSVKNK